MLKHENSCWKALDCFESIKLDFIHRESLHEISIHLDIRLSQPFFNKLVHKIIRYHLSRNDTSLDDWCQNWVTFHFVSKKLIDWYMNGTELMSTFLCLSWSSTSWWAYNHYFWWSITAFLAEFKFQHSFNNVVNFLLIDVVCIDIKHKVLIHLLDLSCIQLVL